MKKGLGSQGVQILFGEEDNSQDNYFYCRIEKIIPNKYQPRTSFDDKNLKELAESIREKGILQPLIVTTGKNNETFNLVAGERRLRASKLVGLEKVPVLLIEVKGEDNLLELALIENIQRKDLNAIEEAEAYQKLIEKFKYTQEEAAKKVGKKRSTITNSLRLLKLPGEIKKDIAKEVISEGHGRVLIKLINEPIKLNNLRNIIVKNGLSVRQTERYVKNLLQQENTFIEKDIPQTKKDEISNEHIKKITTQLTKKYKSNIVVNQKGKKGVIEITYSSVEDLDRVTALLLKK